MANINEVGKIIFNYNESELGLYIYQDDIEHRIYEDTISVNDENNIPNPKNTGIITEKINDYYYENAELVEVYNIVDNDTLKVKNVLFYIQKFNKKIMFNSIVKYQKSEKYWENYGLSYNNPSILKDLEIK